MEEVQTLQRKKIETKKMGGVGGVQGKKHRLEEQNERKNLPGQGDSELRQKKEQAAASRITEE
jgi:hypothetical protein